jgi:hypothetical protein
MGSNWSIYNTYQRYYKIIYLQDQRQRYYSIQWPDTFAELLQVLRLDFNYSPKDNKVLVDDISDHGMYVKSQTSFMGLVPKYKKIEPDIHVFYVGLAIVDNT